MMIASSLQSLAGYSTYIAERLQRSSVQNTTLSVWSASPYTGIAEGEILFTGGYRLRIREEVDFDAALITSYGYEVYRGEERLYWYDDFPHPRDLTLASTHPHHKHIHPDIKHHRIPAPGIHFDRPNLDYLLQEIEGLLNK